MPNVDVRFGFVALAALLAAGSSGCRSNAVRSQPGAAVMAASPAPQAEPPREVFVDNYCFLREEGPVSPGAAPIYRQDNAVCHLDSVLNSSHIVERVTHGETRRWLVSVAEQEYVLQDVWTRPTVFVVEHRVPPGGTVDSDPKPVKMDGQNAVFRVMAEPGQIVRLHVGVQGPLEVPAGSVSQ